MEYMNDKFSVYNYTSMIIKHVLNISLYSDKYNSH